MDIGKPKKVIEVTPVQMPDNVPETAPVPEREPEKVP